MYSITTESKASAPVMVPPVEVKVTTSKSSASSYPPLFSFQITNPITYLKEWWKKLIGNEGLKVTIQVKPVTAFILTCMVTGVGFGAGRLSVPEPFIKYLPIIVSPSPTPWPSPNPWKESAFTGKIQLSGGKYFLVTSAAEAIKLDAPATIDLAKLVGKRIFVSGLYDKLDKIFVVTDIKNVELLTASPLPVPTIKPTPSTSLRVNPSPRLASPSPTL